MLPLITLAHGSRHERADHGIDQLTRAAAELLRVPGYCAHLDLSEPSLIHVTQELATAGYARAVVVPLLFTTAYHKKVDVPAAVEEAHHKSGLDLILAEGLGVGDDIADVLATIVTADAPDTARVVLYSVGTSCNVANQTVLDLAAEVARRTSRSVDVVPATGGNGSGGAGIMELAVQHPDVHVLPLFVTEGLLLDKVTTQLSRISAATGNTSITVSPPLTTRLDDIVAARYRACAFAPVN